MRRTFVFLAVILLSVAAISMKKPIATAPTQSGGAAALEPSALEKQLRDADLAFAKQTAARGLEGWMDFFADDASTIHDGKTVTGKPALRAYYAPVFANKDFSLTWTPSRAEAAKDGTLGYTYGDYEAKNGAAVSRGVYVTVWRRENGRWKVVLDLGSAARPQSTEPKPQN